MASNPKVKATYSLDQATVRLLERVSRRWGVSKSEALRRAIRASAAETGLPNTKLDVLDRAQREVGLTPAAAAAWKKRVRQERRAASDSETSSR